MPQRFRLMPSYFGPCLLLGVGFDAGKRSGEASCVEQVYDVLPQHSDADDRAAVAV